MKIFRECSWSQKFLLPPLLDEFVPEDHEARIINEVVDRMDLSPLLLSMRVVGHQLTSRP